MKWQHYLTSVCFAFLGLFVGSFIINQNSVSAVSDVTYTIDSSNYSSLLILCGHQTSYSCFDYSYIYIVYNNFSFTSTPSSDNIFIPIEYTFNTSQRKQRFPADVDFVLSTFPFSNITSYSSTQVFIRANTIDSSFISSLSPGWSITITLTDSNPFISNAPSGSLSITENGTYDVTNYAEAVVEVPDTETIIQGDYHDDLVSINNSIMVCAGVCLVLYFFYCIYRMFIKTGGK